MFSKETYVQRRALLKKSLGSGILLFLGNDDMGLNYEDNTFRYRQDSSFLYYFGLSFAGLSAVIDIDNDKDIVFEENDIKPILELLIHDKKNEYGNIQFALIEGIGKIKINQSVENELILKAFQDYKS